MYEETFGTDWERLEHEEILRRAFALGVAEGLGSAPDGELERLQSELSGRYGQSLVELAYDEGRTKGRKPRPDSDDEEVWDELVVDEEEPVEPPEHPTRATPPRATDLPENIATPALLEMDRDDLAKLDLPEFLR